MASAENNEMSISQSKSLSTVLTKSMTSAALPESLPNNVDIERQGAQTIIGDVDLIPGTEVLNDVHGFYSQRGVLETDGNIILIPEPSHDIHDPLNWSPTWKAIVLTNQALFVFISVLTPLCIAPMTPIFIEVFHKDVKQVNLLFGVAAITLGWANLAIVPFANVFGRRQTSLICGLICVLANVWQAAATDYNSFLAARVISGLGAAANESIMPMVIADVMFIHQRGLWLGLYFWSYFVGVQIGPVISGTIAQQINYHWFFWICTILQGASLLGMAFTLPETLYHRSHIRPSLSLNQEPKSKESSDTSPSNTGSYVNTTANPNDDIQQDSQPPEKAEASAIREIALINRSYGIGRPSLEQFNWFPKPISMNKDVVIRDIITPLYIFAFPIILWATMAFGFAANCLLGLNLTQSMVFAAPPYLFTPAQVGFVNFAFVVGGIAGLLSAGPVSDFVSLRAARRNNGIREAEFRLIALVPFILISLIGMVVAGVGYQRHYSWESIVLVGFSSVGIQVVSIPVICISYAIDCYPNITGEILVSATIVKNTFGFGMIFFLTDWATSAGFIPPILTLMALSVGFAILGPLLFPFYGKQLRRLSKDSKIHDI